MGGGVVRDPKGKIRPLILVDTSVWIDYFRGRESAEVATLERILQQEEDLCISGIILTEILQGVSSETEYRRVRSALDPLIFLNMPLEAYHLAAEIYRNAKSRGRIIRNTIDCLIAACAIVHHAPLLHCDKDYETISKVSRLKCMT